MQPSDRILDELAMGRKSIEGRGGWLFLTIGNGANALAQQFGLETWSADEINRANVVMAERKATLPGYKKYIVPEKSVAYREYLPDPLRQWQDSPSRPSQSLTSAVYLLKAIESAKPFGPLYFRGDTHPNWLGSYFMYREIAQDLGLFPIPLSALTPTMVGYDGDLYQRLPPSECDDYRNRANFGRFTLDSVVKLELALPSTRRTDADLYQRFDYETLIYETDHVDLPRAVIFRDSTAQFMVDLLAQHFSRSVFVWYGLMASDIIDREQPDMVFQIMAERLVWRDMPVRSATANDS